MRKKGKDNEILEIKKIAAFSLVKIYNIFLNF